MKTLRVTKAEQFEMLYEALLGKREGYTIKQGKVIAKVFDKMEACGKIKETIGEGAIAVDLYTPTELPCKIDLEDEEFKQAKAIFDDMTWSGRGMRKAVEVSEWLDEMERDSGKSSAKIAKV